MKLFPLHISISLPSFVGSWVVVQRIYSKIHPVSCTNIYHDITDLINHRMVKNTKTSISWEQNINVIWNKNIFNLCLRWHILRNYCFVFLVFFGVSMVCKLRIFSGIIRTLGSNQIWRNFWCLNWQKLPLQLLATTLIFFFRSLNYANLVFKLFLYFQSDKIHKHCLYWKVLEGV